MKKEERSERVYFEDIFESIKAIEEYTRRITSSQFGKDVKTQDAVFRRLEIIGEAVKNIFPKTKRDNPDIPWKKIAGMRDNLIHEYFGVKIDRVWKTIKKDLPVLKKKILELLE